MTLKMYLLIMSIASALSWAFFFFVIFSVNAFTTNWVGFALFYASLFISLIGTITLLGFVLRFTVLRKELVFRLVSAAFRQSFLFSFLVISILFLLSKDLFTWINAALLAMSLTVLEFFSQAARTTKAKKYERTTSKT
jgi:hypothetical protein